MNNHWIENFYGLCHSCHVSHFHSGPKLTSKFKRIYGMKLKDLSRLFNVSIPTICNLHKAGELSLILAQKLAVI
jgi:hypothetical protein